MKLGRRKRREKEVVDNLKSDRTLGTDQSLVPLLMFQLGTLGKESTECQRWLNTVLARSCCRDSARAQGLQDTDMPSIQRSSYLLNAHTICAIFLHDRTQCTDGFSLLLQGHVREGDYQKNPVNQSKLKGLWFYFSLDDKVARVFQAVGFETKC